MVVYFESKDTIIETFPKLGVGENLPTLETLDSIEKFVVNVYGENKCPATISSLAEVRLQLFSKYQYDAERLPPTSGALKYRVFRWSQWYYGVLTNQLKIFLQQWTTNGNLTIPLISLF